MTCRVQLKSVLDRYPKLFKFNVNSPFESTKEKACEIMGYAGTFHRADGTEITDNRTLKAVYEEEKLINYCKMTESTDANPPGYESLSFPVQVTRHDTEDSEQKYRYDMNRRKRGHCIIVNNEWFVKKDHRMGTEQDVDALKTTFKELGFEVQVKENINGEEMHSVMINAARDEHHKDCDCFVAVFLTHGDKENNVEFLFGSNDNEVGKGSVAVENLITPFKSCKSLAGKPKIFIFQACRGKEADEGIGVDADVDPPAPRRIPANADFLFVYSCPSGKFSTRNEEEGAWFIQILCQKLDEYHAKLDLVTLLTRVNKQMAFGKERQRDGCKQVSSFVSTLTKELYFP